MKKAILLVAWGAFTPQAQLALTFFEAFCRKRFPVFPIRWAYTSFILRERLLQRRQKSDSVYKALKRLQLENFQAVAIQPLQTIAGREHETVLEAANTVGKETGIVFSVGEPLLTEKRNLRAVAEALLNNLPEERKPEENVIFMGHGARHSQGIMYPKLACEIELLDRCAYIGAMSGPCNLEYLLPRLAPGPVWLMPLLSTIGRHAISDMAGAESESWRSQLEQAGHKCYPVLRGMAESEHLANFWLDNLDKAIEAI